MAAARQPAAYSPVRDTISALAGLAAADRWVMTTGLAGLGICHVVTALGLRPAPGPARAERAQSGSAHPGGRSLLAAGGVATVAVAALPLPVTGTSPAHRWAAGVALTALAVWPALAWRRRPVAWVLRAAVSVAAAVAMLGLLGWFAVELSADGPRVGLTERFIAGAEAIWPLVVVVAVARSRRGEVADPATAWAA